MVTGMYIHRKIPLLQKFTSWLFYKMVKLMTGYQIDVNAACIRVMRRRFLVALQQFTEKIRFMPLIERWLGFKQGFAPITHHPRQTGNSTYNLRRRLKVAFDSIITFTHVPLKVSAYLGAGVAVFGFGLIALLIIQKLFIEDMLLGYTSTVAAVIFLGGIQIFCIGMASLYIGKILQEVQNRPLYIVRQKLNFDQKTKSHRLAG